MHSSRFHFPRFFTGEWDNACNELQKMLLIRSLREDRVSFTVTNFIINNLGSRFTEPPVLDMPAVVDDSNTRTPLIFVLSPGVVSVGGSLAGRTKPSVSLLIFSDCVPYLGTKVQKRQLV